MTTPLDPLPAVVPFAAVTSDPSGPSTLSKTDKSLMLARARDRIYRVMIVDDAVPIVVKRDEMVEAAIDEAMRSVTTDVRIQVPTSAKKEVIGAMSALRRAFKQCTFYQVNCEFGLRLEGGSTASKIEHWRERVKHLLTDFNFLRDLLRPETEYFSSPFFQHFMIDMLFLAPMKLWQYVDGLDIAFALRATAIAAALTDFWHGYYRDVDSRADNWRGYYTKATELITLMRSDPTRSEWLTRYQQSLIAQGKVELPPATSTSTSV